MAKFNVEVQTSVTVEIDLNELSEDEDEHSLIVRAIEENHPELGQATLMNWTEAR